MCASLAQTLVILRDEGGSHENTTSPALPGNDTHTDTHVHMRATRVLGANKQIKDLFLTQIPLAPHPDSVVS